MTFQEFQQLQDDAFIRRSGLAKTKGKEYAHSEDRFANFNRLATDLGISNVMVGYIFFKKHLDSIISYIKDGQTYSTESIEGRFDDAILYLELIYGMIKETQPKEMVKPEEVQVNPTYNADDNCPCCGNAYKLHVWYYKGIGPLANHCLPCMPMYWAEKDWVTPKGE